MLNCMSKSHDISLSTLKLNAKILRDLGMIEFGNCANARLTDFGKLIVSLLGDSYE
jgi:hypothetical protein